MDGVLEPGMVLTVEPGLYFQADDLLVPAEFRGIGVRIEDDVLVTADGCENLSAALPRASARRRGVDGGAAAPLSSQPRRVTRGRVSRTRASGRCSRGSGRFMMGSGGSASAVLVCGSLAISALAQRTVGSASTSSALTSRVSGTASRAPSTPSARAHKSSDRKVSGR